MAATIAGAACTAGAGSAQLLAIEALVPAHGLAAEATGTVVHGEFPPRVTVSYTDRSASNIDTAYRLHIGAHAADDVRWLDSETLAARVPAVLAPGTYDATVVGPGGRSATLARAFTVFDNAGDCRRDAHCADPCYSGAACVDGRCVVGIVDKDSDSDGAFDAACPGGDDCDDDNDAIFPGSACDDGDSCTDGEICDGGVCAGGADICCGAACDNGCATGCCTSSCSDLGCQTCTYGCACDTDCVGLETCRPDCRSNSTCTASFTGGTTLRASCTNATCVFACTDTTTCRADCVNGGSCELQCTGADSCTMTCDDGADCLLRCNDATTCGIVDECDNPIACGDGVWVCNRDCP